MKKLLCFVLLWIFLPVSVLAYNGDTAVYVTRTGECYHRDGCSYLYSRIPTTLETAVDEGYRACSRCKPPKLGEDAETDAYSYDEIREYRREQKENRYSTSTPASSNSMAIQPQIPVSAPVDLNDGSTEKQKVDWDQVLLEAVLKLMGYSFLFIMMLVFIDIFRESHRNRKAKRSVSQTSFFGDAAPVQPPDFLKPPDLLNARDPPQVSQEPDADYQLKSEYGVLYRVHTGQKKETAQQVCHTRAKAKPLTPEEQKQPMVYITKKGKCYHRLGCRCLKDHSMQIPLSEAIARGKTPCSKCKASKIK